MLASLLIQPQMLQRLPGRSEGDELVDEIVAIAQLLALNPKAAEAVGPAFADAGTALAETLLARWQGKLPQALNELRALADPLLASLSGFNGLAAPSSAADLLALVANALQQASGVLDLLGDEQIRATVRRMASILGGTLGLSQQGFRDDVVGMLGSARIALRTGNAALPVEDAAIREAMACLLARLETELFPLLPAFDLGADRLADGLIRLLRRTPVPAVLGKADCLVGKLKAVLLALADVVRAAAAVQASAAVPPSAALRPARPPGRRHAVARAASRAAGRAVSRNVAPQEPSNPTAPTPPRSEDGTYCWYASWLYATRRQGFGEGNGFFSEATNQWDRAIAQTFIPGFPADEVWHSKDKRKLVLRRFGIDHDEMLHEADAPFEWHQAPQFAGPASREHFHFGPISAPFLETWTQTSSVLAHSVAGLWHTILMGTSPKEHSNNIHLWLHHWADASARGIGGAPLMSLISRAGDLGTFWTWVVSSFVPAAVFLACSMEGRHTDETDGGLLLRNYLLITIGDLFSAVKVSAITGGVHDLLLSIFTLVNYSGAETQPMGDDDRPRNWDMADPVVGLVNLAVGMVYTAVIARDDYGLPFDGDGAFKASPLIAPLALPGALLVGAFGNLLGTFTAWAICRTTTPAQLGKNVGLGALFATLMFAINFYGAREGDTDDGHYNPRKDPDDTVYGSPVRTDFIGYPDKATSPYRLPFAQGEALFVPQANLGIVSHARFNADPQIYAYDFSHDFKQEILAVRDGTVVDFFDWIPDNIDPNATQQADARTEANLLMPGSTVPDPANPGTTKAVPWRDDAPGWNFICVRHDTPAAGQDRDMRDPAVTTYAVYGHGATGGVRDLWNAKYGLAPAQIIGRKVLRGHPLMAAGSTGNSMHAHLHLHIKSGPAVSAATGALPHALVRPKDLASYTLPFVFGDAPGDGVLKSLNWYASGNPVVATAPTT